MQQTPWSRPERSIRTVAQIVSEIRFELESRFRDVWVRGEISNFKRAPSQHCYFTLKDRNAQIRAVCFRLAASYLRFEPEDGMEVIARGSVSVYPPRGDFQLIVDTMEPAGAGALQAAFEQLKARLEAEGLFAAERKKPLPTLPAKIAVVTSPAGAALHDILRVLERRNDRLHVLIFPVRVQGPEAGPQIARAVRYLSKREDVDVIVVARGGGSLEDLWAFNHEGVARAIAASAKPVVSAVGHETDFTIADFVADIRAPTPSAAAEMVSAARRELADRLRSVRRRLAQATRLQLQRKHQRLHRLTASRAFVDAETRLRINLQRLDELEARLRKGIGLLLERRSERSAALAGNLAAAVGRRLERLRDRSEAARRQLEAYSPLAVLERGYAIVTDSAERVVRTPAQVEAGGRIGVRVAGGSFGARKEE